LILAHAAATGRELVRAGMPVREPTLGKLTDDVELVKPPLPDAVSFQRALDVAAKIFGVSIGGRALHARNLRALSDRLNEARDRALKDRAESIAMRLAARIADDAAHRRITAGTAEELLAALQGSPLVQVRALAELKPLTSESALQRHFISARANAECLADDLVFQSIEKSTDAIRAEARAALAKDELEIALAPALRELALRASKLADPGPPAPVPGEEIFAQGGSSSLKTLDEERKRLEDALHRAGAGAKAIVSLTWSIVRPKP
jgi:hypothetical protein